MWEQNETRSTVDLPGTALALYVAYNYYITILRRGKAGVVAWLEGFVRNAPKGPAWIIATYVMF
jgi:hypothetical protein